MADLLTFKTMYILAYLSRTLRVGLGASDAVLGKLIEDYLMTIIQVTLFGQPSWSPTNSVKAQKATVASCSLCLLRKGRPGW